jgi:hypothetical protein
MLATAATGQIADWGGVELLNGMYPVVMVDRTQPPVGTCFWSDFLPC